MTTAKTAAAILDRPASEQRRMPPGPGLEQTTNAAGSQVRPEKGGTMQKTILAAAAVAAALGVTNEATAAGPVKTETVWFMDSSNTSELFGVVATGAFTDAGTVILNGPGKHPATIHLSHGTIKARARFTERPQVNANPRTCFESEHSAGTLELLGGTGAYQGVTGSGKFTQAANEIVSKAHGTCSFSGDTFVGSQQTITVHLNGSLP